MNAPTLSLPFRGRAGVVATTGSLLALVAALVLTAGPAGADASCREWQAEHRDWKALAVRRYLDASPPERIEAAIFEMLQREAYLTSCELPLERARATFVGWRLVDRVPEEYGQAVMESLLEESGLSLDVRSWFEPTLAAPPPPAPDDGDRHGRATTPQTRRWR